MGMDKLKVMTIFGTRPEAIKMAPLVKELERREGIESLCCVTAQHRQMLDQVLFTQLDSGEKISNIVLMGIGEPLDNFDTVMRFLELVNHPEGLNIGMRHISLSTCGLTEKIDKLALLGLQLTLSVSLHAPDDETRSRLMPVNRGVGVERLIKTCRRYFEKTGRRISYEYAMIDGVNDADWQADLLAKRLRGAPAHVNLIPLNEVEESPLKPSRRVAAFQKRQGLYISCIEEIAYKRGFISKEQLLKLAEPLRKTDYGKYMEEVAEGL